MDPNPRFLSEKNSYRRFSNPPLGGRACASPSRTSNPLAVGPYSAARQRTIKGTFSLQLDWFTLLPLLLAATLALSACVNNPKCVQHCTTNEGVYGQ